MPNIKSAVKRVRVAESKRARNKSIKSSLRTSVKQFEAEHAAAPSEALSKVSSALDKAVAKRAIHKNKAARAKSRMAKRLAAEA